MLARASILATIAIFGSSASAQTTNCHWVGQTWTCDTASRTQLDPNIILHSGDALRTMPNYGDVMEQRARIQAQQAQLRAQEQDEARQNEEFRQQQAADSRGLADRQQSDALHQRVGQKVSRGDCAGAQSAALDAGDFGLANQVKSYCAK